MPEDELLEDGQEEVFSRTEVLLGRIEHHSEAGGAREPGGESPQPGTDESPRKEGVADKKQPRREGVRDGPAGVNA